jgi:hypothetical protein
VRPSTRRRDRAVAATAAAVGIVALFVGAAVASAPVPELARNDPQARAQLLARMRAGEHATYVADYAVTRSNGFSADELLAQNQRFNVRRAGTSLIVDTATKSYDCELGSTTPSCQVTPRAQPLTLSRILSALTAVGVYDVVPTGSVNIAGETGACFRISARSPQHVLPDFGLQTDECLTRDGISLRLRTRSESNLVEEWVAQRVTRTFNATTVAPLLAGFDRTAPPVGR